MDDFGVRNLADDLVGGRIDQVDAVAGGIGLDDDGARGLRRQRKRDDETSSRRPRRRSMAMVTSLLRRTLARLRSN